MARNDRSLQLRRRRLHHAAVLRSLARRRRAAFVTTSVGVFVVALLSMFAMAQAFDGRTPASPLFMVDAAPRSEPTAAVDPEQVPPMAAGEPQIVEPVQQPAPAAVVVELPASEPQPEITAQPAPVRATITFNRRPVRASHQMRMLVTAYCAGSCCCGKHADGITASGHTIATNGGNLVAADTRLLPFGSLVRVPGYETDRIVPVLDRGGKIKGHRLDLLMPTHQQAKQWGARWLDVTVYEYAD